MSLAPSPHLLALLRKERSKSPLLPSKDAMDKQRADLHADPLYRRKGTTPLIKRPNETLEEMIARRHEELRRAMPEDYGYPARSPIRDMPGWLLALLAFLCGLALPIAFNLIAWLWR